MSKQVQVQKVKRTPKSGGQSADAPTANAKIAKLWFSHG